MDKSRFCPSGYADAMRQIHEAGANLPGERKGIVPVRFCTLLKKKGNDRLCPGFAPLVL